MKYVTTLLLGLLLLSFSSCASLHHHNKAYQVSTISALMQGVYDGSTSCDALKDQGDFGVGTFHGLDGELIAWQGTIYKIPADGNAVIVSTETSPFAVVTFFRPEIIEPITTPLPYTVLQEKVDALLPTHNVCCAIAIEGTFSYVKTRSIPRQKKPYPLLVDAVKQQVFFEFHNTTGTIIGFYTPDSMNGVNVPGYHFHFLTADKNAGGHVIDATVHTGTISVSALYDVQIIMPRDSEFYATHLRSDVMKDIDAVEKGK